ncbi:MAG: glycosyltransferase family 39 protein, partial [Proteobacteria bacterium]|nr:glycosyltransferase family 39 protein [Pseudomonadota bacterium]
GARAGARAVLLLAGSLLFMLLSHQLTLDMLLTCWLTAALCCFICAQTVRENRPANRRWMLGCWAAMAAAVLTKGLIGALIPAASMVLYSLLQRDFQIYHRLALRWGLPLFVALAAPWFVLATRANAAFFEFFFVREHFGRYLTTVEHRVQPWWFFVPVLVVGVLPWIGPAVAALTTDGRQRVPLGRFDAVRLLWVWCVFILVFFSLSESKLVAYILPAVPALVLLCARYEPRARPQMLAAGLALTLLLALALGVTLAVAARADHPHGTLAVTAVFMRPLSLLALGLAGGAVIATWQARHGRHTPALAALCLGWCAGSGGLLVGSAPGDVLFSSRELAATLQREAGPSTPVFSVGDYPQTLPFYLRRTVTLVAYRGELDLGLTQAPQLGIDTLDEFQRRWSQLPEGFAVMPPATFAALSRAGLPMRLVAGSGNSLLVSRR